MYTIHADGKLLFDSFSEDVESIALSPKLEQDINKAGSATFVLPPGNVMHGSLERLKTIITVEQDGEQLFRGRVMETEGDTYNQKRVYCEGDRAFLLDSMQTPYYYSGTVRGLFEQLITNHNSMVDVEKQFVIGEVTAVADGETTEVECTIYASTFSEIEERLLNAYGGYLRTRTVGNTHYIDWVKTYGELNTQPIEFTVNLLELTDNMDASDVFTCLIPLGASEIGEDGEYTEPVSIASVNNGLNYIQDDEAVAKYGKIWRSKTWGYEEDPAKLLEKAREYLKTGVALETITLKAIDMHFTDGNVKPIRIGDRVYIISNPHGIAKLMLCSHIEIDLLNPENTLYTFGERPRTLTENVVKHEEEVEGLSGGGGRRSVKEEIGDIIRWAEIRCNEDEAQIEALTGKYNKLTGDLSAAALRLDGVEATAELAASRLDNVENRTTSVELALNGAEGTAGLIASVTEQGERISAAELRIDGVNSKVDMITGGIDISELSKRVTAAELDIDGINARIDLITDATDITDLAKRVSSAEVAIDGLNADILLKADIETTDLLTEEVETLSAQLEVQAEKIEGKVSNSDFQSALLLKADQSSLTTLSKSVDNRFDEQGDLIEGHGTQIKANSDAIALRAVKTEVDAQFEVQAGLIAAKVSNSAFQSALKLKADGTELATLSNSVNTRFNEQGDLIEGHGTQITENTDAIKLRAVKKDVDAQFKVQAGQIESVVNKTTTLDGRMSTAESEITQQGNTIATKVSQADFDALGNRVSDAESSITQQADEIQTKVSQTAFNALGERVATAESSITQQANQIKSKVSQTDFEALGNRVSDAESSITQQAGQIELKVSKNGVISTINQSAEGVKIKAKYVDLGDYATVEKLNADFASFKSTLSSAITSTSGFFTNISTVNFEFGGDSTAWRNITLGDKTGAFLSRSGQGTLDLGHSHAVTVNDDGTITLGGVSSSGGTFKIADTKYYKDGVSAAIKSVTIDQEGWKGRINRVKASNGAVETVFLPNFYTRQGDWNSLNKKYVYFYYTGDDGVQDTLAYADVDASSIYDAGKKSVTLSSDGWVLDGGLIVNATNGEAFYVGVPGTYYELVADEEGKIWGDANTAVVNFYTYAQTEALQSVTVDASEVYTNGRESVTVDQVGWVGKINQVKASNGEIETVMLPTFYSSVDEWNSLNKTLVRFKYKDSKGTEQQAAYAEVDASSLVAGQWDAGVEYAKENTTVHCGTITGRHNGGNSFTISVPISARVNGTQVASGTVTRNVTISLVSIN